MAGKQKIKCYKYNFNGNYIRKYESYSEVIKLEFERESVGKLFKSNKDFIIKNESFIANYRMGKTEVLKQKRISECKYCNLNTFKTDKQVEVFNLLGKKLATFETENICSIMLNIPLVTVWARLRNTGNKVNKDNLLFKHVK